MTYCYLTKVPGGSQPSRGHYPGKLANNRRIREGENKRPALSPLALQWYWESLPHSSSMSLYSSRQAPHLQLEDCHARRPPNR
jgi:hypothetical protein